jgi:hypothetical protein
LPGIVRQGIAQLSLLETALWTLQGGTLPTHKFETSYEYPTTAGRMSATVTVRAPLGLQSFDEYVLWGLLGATLSWKDPDPVLLATPYWMLKSLGLKTGGTQYTELRESLLRLAIASYQNTAFYNPEAHEHQYVAFQFLSILLPTVGGIGKTVDTERSWRIEWNPAFFRFCKATGGNLHFDLDLYRSLSPAARRLFLKLKDRFWRSKKVFLNVDDLTTSGLGFSALRPLKKRKFDLKNCIRELLDHDVIKLGRGQTDPEELFVRRGKGSYVVVFYEGDYFRQPTSERVQRQKNAIADHPLHEPLRKIGVDGPAIARLLKSHDTSLIQRWVRITEAAMHEKPRNFAGFKNSAAAFLIDGVQNNRTPPDWFHAHAKRQEKQQWQEARTHAAVCGDRLQQLFEADRAIALQAYLDTPEGRRNFDQSYRAYLELFRVTQPHRAEKAAREAARTRIERSDLAFPEFAAWAQTNLHRTGEAIA